SRSASSILIKASRLPARPRPRSRDGKSPLRSSGFARRFRTDRPVGSDRDLADEPAPTPCLDSCFAALVGDMSLRSDFPPMPLTPRNSPARSLYLITPRLSAVGAEAFAQAFAEVVEAAATACALVRFAPGSEADAKAI